MQYVKFQDAKELLMENQMLSALAFLLILGGVVWYAVSGNMLILFLIAVGIGILLFAGGGD